MPEKLILRIQQYISTLFKQRYITQPVNIVLTSFNRRLNVSLQTLS